MIISVKMEESALRPTAIHPPLNIIQNVSAMSDTKENSAR